MEDIIAPAATNFLHGAALPSARGDHMRLHFRLLWAGLVTSTLMVAAMTASAQEPIKIGFVGPYTGPFAVAGQSYRYGVEAFMALQGNTVGGRKVEVIYRDSAGADPTLAKRLAEELVVKEKVAMLAGFYLSPEVAATAPVVNAAKVPLVIV